MRQPPTSFRLTPDGRKILEASAKKLGISKAGVVELALREFAQKNKVSIK